MNAQRPPIIRSFSVPFRLDSLVPNIWAGFLAIVVYLIFRAAVILMGETE